jgi:hypothetical protein
LLTIAGLTPDGWEITVRDEHVESSEVDGDVDVVGTDYAKSLHHDDIAPTEWPMFGSVFFLVKADDLSDHAR